MTRECSDGEAPRASARRRRGVLPDLAAAAVRVWN